MIRAGSYSLGRRLSSWFALQSLLGLLFVCAAVYAATFYAFKSRQLEDLSQKQNLVLHLASESGRDDTELTLKHKLEDFLVGHAEFGLSLKRADGSMFFEQTLSETLGPRRSVQFEFSTPLAGRQPLHAELSVDIRKDVAVLRRIGIVLAMAAVAGALLISFGGFLLVWLGLRPLRDLSTHMKGLTAQTLHRRLDASHQPDELSPVVAQFNDLLIRLDRSYERLEGFNADVAHELLTPLANLMSGTELALRSSHSAGDLQELLGSNLEDLQRVSGIVHDMLFLSRADRGAAARRTKTPSLAAVARQVIAYHHAALDEAGLQIQVVGDADGEFDTSLLQRALSNLISNATRYANLGSTVRVLIESMGDEVKIQVENTGASIDHQALPKLFDRFFRGETSRSNVNSTTRNHGLGLSIVEAIARMHGGKAIAASVDGVTAIGLVLKRSA